MTNNAPEPVEPELTGTILDFTPVPLERVRANGWTVLAQRRFIHALSVMGSVGAAARAVGIGRVSAYRLREREGAESFAAAWDNAIGLGRSQQYSVAMDAAMNGVTTVRVLRGGSVSVTGGPDISVIRGVLREPPVPPPITQAQKQQGIQ
jgi:hypothetical protein